MRDTRRSEGAAHMGGRATGLRKLFDERLPINRKERYYAGPPRAPASDLREGAAAHRDRRMVRVPLRCWSTAAVQPQRVDRGEIG